jgi:hypothetical protein
VTASLRWVLAYLTGAYEQLWVEVFKYTNNCIDPPTLTRVGAPLGLNALENPAVSKPIGARIHTILALS